MEKMNRQRKIVGAIRPNGGLCTPDIYSLGIQLGEKLADTGYQVVCGGMQGVMEAVCLGVHQSENYQSGMTIGILPGTEKVEANPHCDILIPTGMGFARNAIIVQTANVLVAIAGGAVTLPELAFVWQSGKKVVCYTGFFGWS